jgi:hypothetical protein
MNIEDMKRSRRRRAHPLLLLMQRGSYRARKSELLRQGKCTDGDCSLSSTDEGMNEWKEANSDNPQECCQLSRGGEESFEPFWLESGSPSVSEKSASWIGKVTNLHQMSVCLSRGPSFSSDLSRRPSLSSLSSSYTSWTRPFAKQHVSDSNCPASSILDNDDNDDIDDNDDKDDIDLEENVLQNDIHQRRKSSSDTCNDIDDIEDFEFDDLNDCDIADEDDRVFIDDEPMKEGDNKRLSGVMSSPDLAYGSMDGSFDHQDGD